jgi:S1-C subfamily serine protease
LVTSVKGLFMDPALVIVPIFGMHEGSEIGVFLGTGFFVGPEGLLMTAEHVVRDWQGSLAIVCMHDLRTTYAAKVIECDRGHDIALLRVDTYRPPNVLALAFDEAFHPNVQVLTFEYGTTTTNGNQITLNPDTRIGNVTRLKDMSMLGPAGVSALELSFPALRGASGAPVMRADNHRVWGVIVSNVSYHLLPAQIESVLDEGNNFLEEIRYMLPQAAAVNIRHAREMFDRHTR